MLQKSTLETWLLKPSSPHLMRLRARLLNVLVGLLCANFPRHPSKKWVVETILAPSSLPKGLPVECLGRSSLCKFPKRSFRKCLGDLVVEAILTTPSVPEHSLDECPCCFSFCKFPKRSFKKCLVDLVAEAILTTPSVLEDSLDECPCCFSLGKFPKRSLKKMPCRLGC